MVMKITEALLTINEFSRPAKPIYATGIALHWVENAKTYAIANRRYFEERKRGGKGYGSAHYIIDMSGEIIWCIPEREMAYHVGADRYTEYAKRNFGDYPNSHLIGIELCHVDDYGKMTKATWAAAVELCAYICLNKGIEPVYITTHSAITMKRCPRWFVDHPKELFRFRQEVKDKTDDQK